MAVDTAAVWQQYNAPIVAAKAAQAQQLPVTALALGAGLVGYGFWKPAPWAKWGGAIVAGAALLRWWQANHPPAAVAPHLTIPSLTPPPAADPNVIAAQYIPPPSIFQQGSNIK